MTNEELKQLIMQQFERQNCKPNHVIPMRFWYHTFMNRLNPKEQDIFSNAVNELIDEGKLIYEPNGFECLRLTELGYQDLYHQSKSIQVIEKEIMDKFKEMNSRPGNVILMRNLNGYVESLNPIEQERFVDAINNLIDRGYIVYNDQESLKSFELTQKGYDLIF